MTRWKQATVMVVVVALLAFAWAIAQAADQPAGGRGHCGPHMGQGPHGVAPWRGYIEPNAQTKALWAKLGKIQADLHAAQWDLFVLMAQKPQDQGRIRAQQERIKKLQEAMRNVWTQLKPHWRPLEPQAGGKAGAGCGARHGRGGA